MPAAARFGWWNDVSVFDERHAKASLYCLAESIGFCSGQQKRCRNMRVELHGDKLVLFAQRFPNL
jgi:hypothetical protein